MISGVVCIAFEIIEGVKLVIFNSFSLVESLIEILMLFDGVNEDVDEADELEEDEEEADEVDIDEHEFDDKDIAVTFRD
jgi:hypothetical protein